MRLALVALVAVGCGFPHPSEDYACTTTGECEGGRVCERGFCVVGSGDDAAIDVPTIDAPPDLCLSFAARHFDACMIPAPSGDLVLDQNGTYVYNTDTAMLMPPSGSPSMPATQIISSGRLISVNSLSIVPTATLRVVGTRPLIVASWSTISVSGAIDVSSNITGPGAGADPADCSSHASMVGGDDLGGGGGGGGGGFHGTGGDGGAGSDGTGLPGTGGGAIAIPLLQGGCKGANGGAGDEIGGTPGAGGGAIQLTAKDDITIAGTIHAGGAGGGEGTVVGVNGDAGGGGGGSGGMIGLEAPSVSLLVSSIVAANGGGGGEGTNSTLGPNQRGVDGGPNATRASGGAGTDGGDGGAGGGNSVLNGNPGILDGDGGGGGGGGVGYIAIKTANLTSGTGIQSPLHTTIP